MTRSTVTRSSLHRTAAAVVLAAAVALPVLALPAAAQAPAATGWWSFASRDGLPQPPSPPDVGKDDLLLQGGDPSGSAADGAADPAPPTAVAALRFAVPTGSTVGALRLQVASGAVAQDVRAYRADSVWTPAQGGPLADAPPPDRSRSSQGVLQGSVLVFPDVARLLGTDGTLSVVLLPGSVDRVVVRAPDATALTVTPPPTAAAPTPAASRAPAAAPVPAAAAPPAASDGTAASTSDGALPLPDTAAPALPDAAAVPGPQLATTGPAPVEAPATGQTVQAAPAASRASSTSDDDRTRYLAAAEAALVLALFGLLGWGPLARLSALVQQPTTAASARGADERGVGRFVRARTGRPARL